MYPDSEESGLASDPFNELNQAEAAGDSEIDANDNLTDEDASAAIDASLKADQAAQAEAAQAGDTFSEGFSLPHEAEAVSAPQPVLDAFVNPPNAAPEPTAAEPLTLTEELEHATNSSVILVPRARVVFGDTLEEIAKQKAAAEARKAQLQEALADTEQQLNDLAELELITEDPEARRAVELGAKLGISLG